MIVSAGRAKGDTIGQASPAPAHDRSSCEGKPGGMPNPLQHQIFQQWPVLGSSRSRCAVPTDIKRIRGRAGHSRRFAGLWSEERNRRDVHVAYLLEMPSHTKLSSPHPSTSTVQRRPLAVMFPRDDRPHFRSAPGPRSLGSGA